MGAVTESGMLLVGTNNFAILTQGIEDWCNYEHDDLSQYQEHAMIGMGDSDEESKVDDDSQYDPLEGKDLDSAFAEAIDGTNMTLEMLQRQQRDIMAADARGAQNY